MKKKSVHTAVPFAFHCASDCPGRTNSDDVETRAMIRKVRVLMPSPPTRLALGWCIHRPVRLRERRGSAPAAKRMVLGLSPYEIRLRPMGAPEPRTPAPDEDCWLTVGDGSVAFRHERGDSRVRNRLK